ncbi:hypothetical protein KGMB01110_00360 [Mediterraneibacter butyricigenes]|jgi:cell division topological specificity factor|uniref:Cell division topological specificity factor MinE n=1 Tax=Mediterraneibacter butyricigenes TaxID=2316025 RepID=A0A391NYM9_9FIRM|nr:cell division topological specificity factor MinE [Mediterraneibacter butyricigenes]RGO28144.1 cell division topological specificity factor MinE [Dorea sp. OM02-2LB]RGV97431.1 cell division topological specificity factor MinE [Ruminococcus sp. AF14-10]GCA65600.1 hypothetical protein KGMB01110_00360 [Mediterraneibacter butyricigenes]
MSTPSVTIAKKRLKSLIVSDRMECTSDMIDNFTKDLYLTVSKYIEVSPEKFQIRIQRSEIQITFTGEDF